MRTFSESWPNREIVQSTAAQITWRNNMGLLDKLKDPEVRIWYVQKTLRYGWSREILTIQIESCLHERQGKALNIFDKALPPADSDMTVQVFNDPYLFDFPETADLRKERDGEEDVYTFTLRLHQKQRKSVNVNIVHIDVHLYIRGIRIDRCIENITRLHLNQVSEQQAISQ